VAEFNLIQAPEVLRKLAQRLGVRQAHITPTLNSGVQAVIVVDDLTKHSPDVSSGAQPRLVYATCRQGANAGQDDFAAWTLMPGAPSTFRLKQLNAWTTAAQIRCALGWQDSFVGVTDQAKIGYSDLTLYGKASRVVAAPAAGMGHQYQFLLQSRGITAAPLNFAVIPAAGIIWEGFISNTQPVQLIDGREIDIVLVSDPPSSTLLHTAVAFALSGVGNYDLVVNTVWEEVPGV